MTGWPRNADHFPKNRGKEKRASKRAYRRARRIGKPVGWALARARGQRYRACVIAGVDLRDMP